MTTTKLYHENSYIKTFTATITKATPLANEKWAVVLNCTAFYPESGGQPYSCKQQNEINSNYPIIFLH